MTITDTELWIIIIVILAVWGPAWYCLGYSHGFESGRRITFTVTRGKPSSLMGDEEE